MLYNYTVFLQVNTALRDLNLSNNDFSEGGAVIVGRGIGKAPYLTMIHNLI